MSRLLSVTVVLLCFESLVHGQITCPINVNLYSAHELIKDPPPGWNFECMNERLLNEALTTESHARSTVECMEKLDKAANVDPAELHLYTNLQCDGRGYEVIAEEIFSRVGEGGRCLSCSSRLNVIVQKAVIKMQSLYPKLLRRGLSIMG